MKDAKRSKLEVTADLTFSRCFVQSVSSRDRNEVIPVALKS